MTLDEIQDAFIAATSNDPIQRVDGLNALSIFLHDLQRPKLRWKGCVDAYLKLQYLGIDNKWRDVPNRDMTIQRSQLPSKEETCAEQPT